MGAAPAAVQLSAPTFLEVPVDLVMPGQGGAEGCKPGPPAQDGTGTLIEVAAANGSMMRIQLGGGSLGAAGVVTAFLGEPI